jgi:hypothetical protein
MENNKDFNEWRAGKLGYVYFSRLDDLIINEPNFKEPLFDYLIDIGEEHKQTGRLFGVEIKAFGNPALYPFLNEQYRNIAIPALLVLFDNKTDRGYFKWIKKPGQNGQLAFENTKNTVEELNNDSLHQIVAEIKNWYSYQHVA